MEEKKIELTPRYQTCVEKRTIGDQNRILTTVRIDDGHVNFENEDYYFDGVLQILYDTRTIQTFEIHTDPTSNTLERLLREEISKEILEEYLPIER